MRTLQENQALIEAFQTYQPVDPMHQRDWSDIDGSSAIAFTPSPSRHLLPSASPGSEEDAPGHAIESFDPSVFCLPPNAANKIRSFCRLFCLEGVHPPSTSHTIADAANDQTSSTTTKIVEPGWHMWATSECDP